jgi:hypothetical protein
MEKISKKALQCIIFPWKCENERLVRPLCLKQVKNNDIELSYQIQETTFGRRFFSLNAPSQLIQSTYTSFQRTKEAIQEGTQRRWNFHLQGNLVSSGQI